MAEKRQQERENKAQEDMIERMMDEIIRENIEAFRELAK